MWWPPALVALFRLRCPGGRAARAPAPALPPALGPALRALPARRAPDVPRAAAPRCRRGGLRRRRGAAGSALRRLPPEVPRLAALPGVAAGAAARDTAGVALGAEALFVTMCFFFWIYMLAGHYVARDGISSEMCILLLFTATIMSISVCSRFHRGVQMIWNTPNKWRYLRLFGLYSALCHMVVFRALAPSQWAGVVAHRPWLSSIHAFHVLVHSSEVGTIVLSGFSLLYISTASGAIFLFWKTSLRVPTVASVPFREVACFLPKVPSGSSQCGLCQLGLCLDNDRM
eukprot:CAMPEP_0179093430 /NCGR_PEP_ID=MMETSP0796-20121207/42788_1 /TAXON_ID=73915 /ORGANISM="Pyrodinium bahamense, Strain pbaha01" /LENGTH=286 /DNA_ID=CAMNT_0020791065 /DNA_START=19 /DNA_END=880 /DNA_ORIENTATION=+